MTEGTVSESEMIERVARAIYGAIWEARPTQKPCPYEEQDEPEVTLAMARAAITELREPTEAMVAAGFSALAPRDLAESSANPEAIWHAMIDAALGTNAKERAGPDH